MSEFTSWNESAYALIFKAARRLRIGVEKAKTLAEDAVRIAGPGLGHRRVGYRILPTHQTRRGKCVDGYICFEMCRGDAHTEPVERATFISERDVKRLWRLIKKTFPVHADYTSLMKAFQVKADYKFNVEDVAKAMVAGKMLPPRFNYETFSGGEKRANYYFPTYLYPMRVLDYLDYIRFGQASWRVR